jgi:beta-1,4-N-acetylglucosaminyltransferase
MKIGLVCSHGGHWSETCQLFESFANYDVFVATYHSARANDVQRLARTYFTDDIGTNVWRMARATVWAARILLRERPDVLISLGAEIAIPFFYLAKLFKIKTLFIESWCRISTLSKTGRLLYPIADEFWVQWPQLLSVAGPKAHYKGAVV